MFAGSARSEICSNVRRICSNLNLLELKSAQMFAGSTNSVSEQKYQSEFSDDRQDEVTCLCQRYVCGWLRSQEEADLFIVITGNFYYGFATGRHDIMIDMGTGGRSDHM